MKRIFIHLLFLCFLSTGIFAQGISLKESFKEDIHAKGFHDHEGHTHGGNLFEGTEVVDVVRDGQKVIAYINMSLAAKEFMDYHASEEYIGVMEEFFLDKGFAEVEIMVQHKGSFVPVEKLLSEDDLPALVYQMPENDDPFPDHRGDYMSLRDGQRSGGIPHVGQVQPTGALTGKTVWLSPGHGYIYNTGVADYRTQRGNTHDMVEDFGSVEIVGYYLLQYLWNAGANVWMVRERDFNTNEVIVDNDGAGYTETGSWNASGTSGYNGGTYKFVNSAASESATASFTPTITEEGWYWVSTYYREGVNRSVDARYQVHHAGGVTEVSVNQEVHGQTWYYLGQFYFDGGTAGKVVLTNESTEIGQAIIADAVRFGGGVGTEVDCDVAASVGTSGFPRFEEGAQMYAPFMGYGTCNGDVSIRPNYAEWELSKGTAAEQNNSGTNDWNSVYVSWHTNAGGGQGTSSFIYEPGTPSQNDNAGTPTNCDGSAGGAASGYLRNYIHDQVITDIHADWDPMWTDRGKKCAYFGEISNNLSTMPGVLLEMGFHDNMGDATAITTPDFRQLEARAVYKGLVQFFNHYDNTIPLVYAPEQATHLVAKNSGTGQITLTWDAPPTGGVQGDAATTYKVYTSTHGKGFADGVSVSGTTHTITGLLPNTVYYFRVAGMNTGGESIPTSVVAAKTPPSGGTTDVLIVDGFDRLERSQMIQRTTDTALGNLYRGFLDKMNAYTYQVEHARSICECGAFGFDGATNEAVMDNDIALGGYKIVDWFVGEESTGDDTFDATEQAAIIAYLDAGGNIITSGAEIGWDLGRTGISSAADVAFYNNYLKSTYAGDGAGTYFYSGTTGEIFDGNSDSFDDGTTTYDVNFPDRLGASTGATIVLNYSGGTGDGAAVGYDDPSGFGVVNFGFPLETVANQSARTDLICNSINFLDPTLLSVEGLELAGDAERGVNVLNWKTLTEENTDYFVLEKSKDGFTFMEVGKVDAAGLSLEPRKYSLRDKTPYNKTYYRVKLFDFDGTKHYSNVIVLGQEGTLQVNVFPNPTKSNLINININSRNTQGGDFQLFDIAGRLVHQEIFTQNTNQITIQNLAKGAYHYVIMSEGKQAQGKLIRM